MAAKVKILSPPYTLEAKLSDRIIINTFFFIKTNQPSKNLTPQFFHRNNIKGHITISIFFFGKMCWVCYTVESGNKCFCFIALNLRTEPSFCPIKHLLLFILPELSRYLPASFPFHPSIHPSIHLFIHATATKKKKMENAIGQDSRTTSNKEEGDLYVPTKQDEIERLCNIFIRRRIGSVYPRQLADYFDGHAMIRFGSNKFVKDFAAVLRSTFELAEVIRDTSLAISPDDNDIDIADLLPFFLAAEEQKKKGGGGGGIEGGEEVGGRRWEDLLIRQITAILVLWHRIDRALLALAHQHLSNNNNLSSTSTTITNTRTKYHHQSSLPLVSADGMGVIKDSAFATPLLEFFEILNLFPGDGKFLQQILDWFDLAESILDIIHKAIEKREEER